MVRRRGERVEAPAAVDLVVAGGVALPISFAGFDQWYLAWFAFVPLYFAIEGASRKRAALLGFVYGLIANGVGYYWIPYTIHVFGEFPVVLAWAFDLVLCAYQAIQYSLLAYLIVRLRERGHSIVWVAPTAMVGLETVFPLLFPIFMANTQHPVPLLIQVCDLLGPLLLTAIIMAWNASLYVGLRARIEKKTIPWKQVVVGPVALAFVVIYGLVRIPMVEQAMAEGTPVRVGLVQANMGIFEKWEDVALGVRRHREGSRDLARRGAELIIWSEAGFVDGLIRPELEPNLRDRVLGSDLGVPVLLGALTRRAGETRRRTFNSGIMLDADGNVTGTYDKTFLLAFGEYLPFGEVFPELYEYSPHSGRMTPGTRLDGVPFDFEGRRWDLAVLICYEDILPRFTRSLVRSVRPSLLVNMTNDAWFGDTNEPRIHMALAKFRTVEHRRYLVRATNTGVSAFIDPVGRVVRAGRVFHEERLLDTVRLMDGGATLYQAVGDVLGWAALLAIAVVAFQTRRVWLVAPREPEGRAGLAQATAVLLAVGILDALTLAALLALKPAGWTPPAATLVLWVVSSAAMVASFILTRKGLRRGLHAGWAGAAARAAVVALLVAPASAERQATVAVLLGVPAGLALLAAANLYLWRGRIAKTA